MSAHEALSSDQFSIERLPTPEGSVTGRARASLAGEHVGGLSWWEAPGTADHGRIVNVAVHPDHRRKGIATALFEHAKAAGVPIHHSTGLSEDGKAWAAVTK